MQNNVVIALFIALLPSKWKIVVMRHLGAHIGNDCYIGFSVISSHRISIGDHVQFASFNLIHRLNDLSLGDGSRIGSFNWITGAGTGNFRLGRNSAITRLHFFEASGSIHIGENSIIAGRGTHLFTHGISSTNLDDVRPIAIGPWCYIGSSSRFVPGVSIGRGTFIGMGSVVAKSFDDQFVLVAGNPAQVRKHLSEEDAYFARPFLPHDHHPIGYKGGRPDHGDSDKVEIS
ncbi:MAG: hypothetical protein KDE20_23885 [Caldilineaceae bacterium]|nr:hypothetical protein [Caldilineaceae bacterium]